MDMPPAGQPANFHFDGISAKATAWFDDTIIVENGMLLLDSIVVDAKAIIDGYDAAIGA